eukprot:TRINITY_DN4225_c0_g2_i1.p1 TRINITY_DN4225_c0_g2~~TRINITY_DN4225_c0_g2_i1.p1  ORF type:complete len:359 (+),score=74.51 TRINITY_DN4225_c0_g2_i1:72-1079(+)
MRGGTKKTKDANERRGYVYVKGLKVLDDLPRKLEDHFPKKKFCLSWYFHPTLISEGAYRGLFPMAISGEPDPILALKCHTARCLISLGDPCDLHIEKRTRQKGRDFVLTVDECFQDAMDLCVKHHGENWLYPPLRKCFRYMHKNNESDKYKIKLHSIELWQIQKPTESKNEEQTEEQEEKDGNPSRKLAAVELGYTFGSIYVSLTGCKLMDSAGSIQLCAMGMMLKKRGFKLWDLGMAMDYKLRLGGKKVARFKYLSLVQKFRADKIADLKKSEVNAREIMTVTPSTTKKDPSSTTPSKKQLKRQKRAEYRKRKRQTEKEAAAQKAASPKDTAMT